MTMDRALALLAERVAPVTDVETVKLGEALGRALAEDVISTVAVPPRDNAAVDGYAFRHGDQAEGAAETRLRVIDRAAAGHPAARAAGSGEAIRVFTGAVLPIGTDTCAMQEDCRVEDDFVVIPAGLKPGANRRKAGEDVTVGKIVLTEGARLRAQDIGIAASIGRDRLAVHRRLRVAVFSTGDEVIDPGQPPAPGQIFDANRHALMALLRGLGAKIEDLGILPDDRNAIARALGGAAERCDALITSGGMSTGDEDHVRAAVAGQGAIHFWRLAIRPGRPVALGQVGRTAFIGLPGNPVAAMVTFFRFARPLLLRLGGVREVEPRFYRVRADFEYRKKAERREWLRARLDPGGDGVPLARKFARDGAGILTSMVESHGLVELGEDVTRVEPGMMVDFMPFSELTA